MGVGKQNLVADIVAAAARGDRVAAKGILQLFVDRVSNGRPVEPELLTALSAGITSYLDGTARTLEQGLGLAKPPHDEATPAEKIRAHSVCLLMIGLTTEWERRTTRKTIRHLSTTLAANILAALSTVHNDRHLDSELTALLAGVKDDSRRQELKQRLLDLREQVPMGLTAANIKTIWAKHQAAQNN